MNHSNIRSIMHLKNDIYPGAMDTHKLVPKGKVFKVSKWTKSIHFWKCWKCLKKSRYSFYVHVLCWPQWSGYQPNHNSVVTRITEPHWICRYRLEGAKCWLLNKMGFTSSSSAAPMSESCHRVVLVTRFLAVPSQPTIWGKQGAERDVSASSIS